MEEATLRQLHFFVVPFPAQGHLTPLMHLSKTLAQAGALVTVANIEPVHIQLQSKLSHTPNLNLVSLPFNLNAPSGVNTFWFYRLKEFAQAMYQTRGVVEELVRETIAKDGVERKCIFISDYFIGGREIACNCGAVFANYWPGSAHWCLVHHHLHLLASQGDIPVKDPEKIITYLPGVDRLKLADLPKYAHPNNPETLLSFRTSAPPYACKDDWFFINSVYELEPRVFDALRQLFGPRCISVAPLFSVRGKEAQASPARFSLKNEDVSYVDWLDNQEPRSVLYVSFGSIAPLDEADVLSLAEALEMSKQRFVWVVKPEHFPKEHAGFFSDFVRRAKELEQGIVIEWAPQMEILAHRAVVGFVSHCGWNSVMESICYGVPVIGWPCTSEQRLNCKLVVEDWKMGVRVNKVDEHELQMVITEFMGNLKEFAKNANALKRVLRAAALEGSSKKNMDDFLHVLLNETVNNNNN